MSWFFRRIGRWCNSCYSKHNGGNSEDFSYVNTAVGLSSYWGSTSGRMSEDIIESPRRIYLGSGTLSDLSIDLQEEVEDNLGEEKCIRRLDNNTEVWQVNRQDKLRTDVPFLKANQKTRNNTKMGLVPSNDQVK